jgi:hypothetical protein
MKRYTFILTTAWAVSNWADRALLTIYAVGAQVYAALAALAILAHSPLNDVVEMAAWSVAFIIIFSYQGALILAAEAAKLWEAEAIRIHDLLPPAGDSK